jgi:hypothetical protein
MRARGRCGRELGLVQVPGWSVGKRSGGRVWLGEEVGSWTDGDNRVIRVNGRWERSKRRDPWWTNGILNGADGR